jgi:tRNA-dihydrouridine synthase
MIARGALKAPWMAQDYKRGSFNSSREEVIHKMRHFLYEYRSILEAENVSPRGLLKQNKSVTRFMLEGLEGSESMRRRLILSQTTSEFYSAVDSL